ncbi:MAG: feruloyl-CoA synthase, partial [Pusillimonas sp.]
LIFPNVPACRRLAGLADEADVSTVLSHPAVRERVKAGLDALHATSKGSSTHADRALLMAAPPSVDAGEITDKGYINQSASLRQRAALVEALYADEPGPDVILL